MSENAPPVLEVRLRSKRVQRELDGLQRVDHDRIVKKLSGLSSEPRPAGCEKLEGHIYRVRVGDIRVIYLIDEANKRVDVGGIRRRSESTYKRVEELFR
ncbi:MAG: type II toxin-antitoxin system RelE/ParE family toxin [Chloroflexi bacterium]|nr:type II toxin-antitoxin system RelE/ParE family toxin [Chloroflexota bacterium]